jgi:hypothetical protein
MSENILWLLRDARRARKQGQPAIAQRQRARLTEMVAHARAHSPYYRELYSDIFRIIASGGRITLVCATGGHYAATECSFISYNCEWGWLHVNSDSRHARAG